MPTITVRLLILLPALATLAPMHSADQRFWNKVVKSEACWEWRGAKFKTGYGSFFAGGRTRRAHRWIWERNHGCIPDGLLVLHHCDNRMCVRLDHLFLGNHQDNATDASLKGRTARGERSGTAKITLEQANEIRTSYASRTVSQKKLAEKYGISQAAISGIVLGRKWPDASFPPAEPQSVFAPGGIAAKLKKDDVARIRTERISHRLSQTQLANRFGVTQSCISRILSEKRWRNA